MVTKMSRRNIKNMEKEGLILKYLKGKKVYVKKKKQREREEV